MFFYKILIGAVFFGLLVGLARAKFRPAPVLMSGLVALGYSILLLTVGIWAAQCWDCAEYEDTRGMVFRIWLVLGAALSGAALSSIWAGVGLIVLLRWRGRVNRPH